VDDQWTASSQDGAPTVLGCSVAAALQRADLHCTRSLLTAYCLLLAACCLLLAAHSDSHSHAKVHWHQRSVIVVVLSLRSHWLARGCPFQTPCKPAPQKEQQACSGPQQKSNISCRLVSRAQHRQTGPLQREILGPFFSLLDSRLSPFVSPFSFLGRPGQCLKCSPAPVPMDPH